MSILARLAVLMVRGVPGAFLWGILASTAASVASGYSSYQGVAGWPPGALP